MDTLDNLKNILLESQGAKVRAGIEISVRCPICGDSNNPDHSHLYIGFEVKDNEIRLPYHCKKCGEKGYSLTYNLFQKITNTNDSVIESFLNKINKGNKLLKKSLSITNIEIPEWKLQDTPVDKNDFEKLAYFYKRTNIKLSKKLIKNFKIILNLKNFLKINQLKKGVIDERYAYMINELSENYIGFLSYYNNYIYLRHKLYKPPPKQHKHFRLQLKGYKGRFVYIPKNFKLNIMSEKPKLALTEGVFDLINVQKRFYSDENWDVMFAASGSKGSFNSTINEVISITGFVDLETTLYADSDINLQTIKNELFGNLSNQYKARIIYHKDLKDFGNYADGQNPIIKYEL